MKTDITESCILIVDDNENNRFTLSSLLKKRGYKNLVEAADGKEALEQLAATKVDLVLLDFMMPEMDGFEVLEHMGRASDTKSIPVIMISADDSMENVVKGIELGAVDYLPKPFNTALLNARVKTSLDRNRLLAVEKSYYELFDEETGEPNKEAFMKLLEKIETK